MSFVVKSEEVGMMDPEKRGIKDFLLQLPEGDVLALAKTTAPLIKNKNLEEAMDTILKYSDGNALLHRQKVTKAVLATYLDRKGLKVAMSNTKAKLVQLVTDYWSRVEVKPVVGSAKKDTKDDKSLLNAKKNFRSMEYYFGNSVKSSIQAQAGPSGSSSSSSSSPKESKSSSRAHTPIQPSTSAAATQVMEDKYLDEPVIAPRLNVDKTINKGNASIKNLEAASALPTAIRPLTPPPPVNELGTDAAKSNNEQQQTSASAITMSGGMLKFDSSQTISTQEPKLSTESGPLVTSVSVSAASTIIPFAPKPEMTESGAQTESSYTLEKSLEQRIYEFIENRDREMRRAAVNMFSFELGKGWCEWWYRIMNSSNETDEYGPQHFFTEANVHIEYIQNGVQNSSEILKNGSAAALFLKGFRENLDIAFYPSLVPIEYGGGLQAKMSPHGLADIMVSGTIHDGAVLRQGSNRTKDSAKGLFDQQFVVMQDPADEGRYKVKNTFLRVSDEVKFMLKDKDQGCITGPTCPDTVVNSPREVILLEDFD